MATRVRFNLPSVRSASAALAVALVVVSVASSPALGASLRGALLLVPGLVLQGWVWQLLTYALVEVSPMGVIFGALILWSIGGMLEARWGTRRFLIFTGTIVALAAVATVGVALLAPGVVASAYPGGNVLTGSLWVAYGLLVGRGQTNFWGAAVTGNVLALIGAAFVLLGAAFGGIAGYVPDLFALAFTFLWIRGYTPGQLWTRLRSGQLERDLRRRSRSSHLKAVEGGRQGSPRDRDQYLN